MNSGQGYLRQLRMKTSSAKPEKKGTRSGNTQFKESLTAVLSEEENRFMEGGKPKRNTQRRERRI